MDKKEMLKDKFKDISNKTKTATAFINQILDDKSFVEMDAYLYSDNFGIEGDSFGGVVSGYGTISEKPVYIYCQNYDAMQGGLGKVEANKILKCMNKASKSNTPIISILNTQGAKINEGISVLDSFVEVIAKSIEIKDIVPQIAVVKGECLGQLSCLTATNDIVYMVGEDSAFLSGATTVISANSSRDMNSKQIGGSDVHSKNGQCTFVTKNAVETRTSLDKLLSLLLSDIDCTDDLNRQLKNKKYGDKAVIEIFDKDSYMELNAGFASVKTYIGRLGGRAIALMASGENEVLDCNDIIKISKFIDFANDFSLPYISLVNCSGIVQNIESEQCGIISKLASLYSSTANCTTPKISVVCEKACGSAYASLVSRKIGFDYALAWDSASISIVSKNVGASLFEQEKLAESDNDKKLRKDLQEQYEKEVGNPINAGCDGVIDNIISPSHTRAYLISVLQMLS